MARRSARRSTPTKSRGCRWRRGQPRDRRRRGASPRRGSSRRPRGCERGALPAAPPCQRCIAASPGAPWARASLSQRCSCAQPFANRVARAHRHAQRDSRQVQPGGPLHAGVSRPDVPTPSRRTARRHDRRTGTASRAHAPIRRVLTVTRRRAAVACSWRVASAPSTSEACTRSPVARPPGAPSRQRDRRHRTVERAPPEGLVVATVLPLEPAHELVEPGRDDRAGCRTGDERRVVAHDVVEHHEGRPAVHQRVMHGPEQPVPVLAPAVPASRA